MRIDNAALAVTREYLDTMMYAVIDLRLSLETAPSLTGFPEFESLRRVIGRLDAAHQVLFRLLRLGDAVDDESFRKSIPNAVVTALLATGLVVREPDGSWRTPGLLVVPAEGLLLIAGIPSSYPTNTQPQQAWFDLSTFFVARTLPGAVTGRAVDICSGTGVHALLCASRGATSVVGLELHEPAVVIATANAVLNGLDDRVEFRQSNVLSALDKGETFDFVVCNLPYAPVVAGIGCPSTVAGVGNSVLWPLLETLPAHLSDRARGIVATWRSAGYGGSSYQLRSIAECLTAVGCSVSAYLDPAFDTIDDVLRLLHKDLGQRPNVTAAVAEGLVHQVKELIETSDLPIDGYYNQLVHFSRAPGSPVRETEIFSLRLPS